jgi:hypothetical protein
MEERRDGPPEPEDGSPGLIPSDGDLSPVQRAQLARRTHARRCRQCADIDRPRCAAGEQLWRDWTAALDDAYEQLHGGRP